MDYYSFAAVALPALWVAAGLQRTVFARGPSRFAVARTCFRAALAAGEVAAVTTLAAGHDGYLGAALTSVGLLAGVLTVVAKSAQRDLAPLGLPRPWLWSVVATGVLTVVAYATAR